MADDNLDNDQISVKDDSPEQEPTKLQKRRTKMLNNTTKLVPGRLNLQKGTNFRKLFRVLNFSLFGTKRLVNRVDQWRSISKAKGKALDAIGEDWGVYRNGSDDDFYRFLIRFKQSQSRADGSVNSLIKVISDALGADPKDISIKNFPNEPQAIVIDNIPNRYIDNDQKMKMVIQQLENSVAAGIKIAGVHFNDHTQFTIYVGSYLSNFTTYKIPTEEDVTKYHLGTALTTYVSTYGSSFTKYKVPNEEDVTTYHFDVPLELHPTVYNSTFTKYKIPNAEDESIYHLGSTTPVYVVQTMKCLTKYRINERKVS